MLVVRPRAADSPVGSCKTSPVLIPGSRRRQTHNESLLNTNLLPEFYQVGTTLRIGMDERNHTLLAPTKRELVLPAHNIKP